MSRRKILAAIKKRFQKIHRISMVASFRAMILAAPK